jgi:murein DD-endopeptidase MepM/ murein hydrolase activator NlpD
LLVVVLTGVAARTRHPAGPRGDLSAGRLLFPVPTVSPDTLVDGFSDRRGLRVHEAVDIPAPRNSAVVAVDGGSVARLSSSAAGGISVYQLGPDNRYCFYYAHLERYAEGLAAGQPVRKGQLIGYVGTTGNATRSHPHLHFAIYELAASQPCWAGRPIDPYLIWRDAARPGAVP